MIYSVIRFERAGLDDHAETRERNINGFAGFNCAHWLSRSLDSFEGAHLRGEPVPEDWGWAVVVDVGRDTFVLGCANDGEEGSHWHAMLGDNVIRGILPSTRRRRTATLGALTSRVNEFLRAQPGVANITTEIS